MLTVCGFPASAAAKQDDGLILAGGQEGPVGGLGHAVDVGGRVVPPAALEHLHHLTTETRRGSTREMQCECLSIF